MNRDTILYLRHLHGTQPYNYMQRIDGENIWNYHWQWDNKKILKGIIKPRFNKNNE